ncbi:G-type lectin S-receptor-like serine/threonine-protein kinase At1g11330 [Jatropha curcas]|uniref:G-type lectin S-receptor-like serine/threonine-protein kinase At1g11330 n=1 Tax=Jatropha curcas TaxID=180498 RepID=UPI0018942095|nr:G-type lectin S-receptor-like serine/threonine-protein kinase At1g11330 [Jatropha curcas]
MGFGSSKVIVAIFLLACFCIDFRASSIDTITSSQFIKDPEFVVSPGNTFKLGFFSPVNSTNRYVGIWYYENPMFTPIWIANRNKPLNDSSGIMKVYEDGNLVVLNGNGEVLWSSSVSTRVDNSSAELTDVGDLVLRDNNNGNIIWESFQHPGDSFVSSMKLTANQRTQEKILLTSWKEPSDPSIGSFSAGIDVFEIPQFFIWKGNRPYWRSGQWNRRIFIGVPGMSSGYLDGFLLEGDRSSGNFSFRFTYIDKSHPNIFVLSPEGKLIQKTWTNSPKSWQIDWQTPENECDIYGFCGEFGVCNPENSPVCSCLKGFEPKNADEWSRGNWTGGCVRSRLLQCERIITGDEAGKYDEFSKLETVKVPDLAYWSPSLEQECKDNCLNNCSCIAYSYFSDVGCMSWTGNLIDIQKFSSGGADLYIRLAYSELDNDRNLKVIIGIAVVIGVITISIFAFFMWRSMAKYKERRRKNREMLLVNSNENHPTFSDVNMLVDSIDKVKLQELPVFNLQKLALATGNFDVANKLGQGGFGPVYKGKLK